MGVWFILEKLNCMESRKERERKSAGDDSYKNDGLDVKRHGANINVTKTRSRSPPHDKNENAETSAHLSLDGDDNHDKISRRTDDNSHDEEMG